MKILSQQPWVSVVDFMVRYPDSPEEAKALGRIVYLLRDAIHEKHWSTNQNHVRWLLKEYDWGYLYCEDPEDTANFLNKMVYGEDDDA